MIASKERHSKYYNFLSSVDLFKDINEKDLIDFLSLVQVKQYHKGEMVMLDAKEHARCYIVYEGLFKLVKLDERGDEIVITIADKKDAILPMHFSPHYDICAEFVKNTTLLYFNKESIDQFTSKNHQFSMNLVSFLADSVQKLMLSAEVLQLKTAKEKVGWYLVHSKVNNTFKLPYSKNLVASYLGMKPESFSRALSLLKKEGVRLENKTILLDNGDELCKYCDKVTGSSCQSFKADRCVHS